MTIDAHTFNFLKHELRKKPVNIADPTFKAHYLIVDSNWYEISDKAAAIFVNTKSVHKLPQNNTHTEFYRYVPTAEFEIICKQAILANKK